MRIAKRLAQLQEAREVGFSFEFFCPDSSEGVENLRPRVDRLAATEPVFVDIAANGTVEDLRAALYLARYTKRNAGLASLVHVPCAGVSVDDTRALLDEARQLGIVNVLCERGAPLADASDTQVGRPAFKPHPQGFSHASELVAFVRATYGDAFCVGVMAFPCGYGEYESEAEALSQLHAAQEAGAEFIVLQHAVESAPTIEFMGRMRASAVLLPVVASIMPVHNYESFMRVNAYCGVPVPPSLQAGLESLRHDDNAVRDFGNRAVVALCKELMAQGLTVLHFHTLNLEAVTRSILQDLSLCGPGSAPRRKLPWRPSGDEGRENEDVRPIFWANRPASYLERTAGWTEYPSGRWSSSGRQPGLRPFQTLSEVTLVPSTLGSAEDRRAVWGDAPSSAHDVWEVFAKYVEGRVPRLPWCETELHPETSTITRTLGRMNRMGFLTINSQPRVNGVPSNDPTFGWGGPGGYVYQKAYVECFASATHLAALMEVMERHPSISYQAVDVKGNVYSNAKPRSVQAVTWGVFPDREILQPTVVDSEAFLEWKEEAFALWLSAWASIYDEDSPACALIHDIHDSYFLINVVDNNFVSGDIFRVFEDATQRLREGGTTGVESASSTRHRAGTTGTAPVLPSTRMNHFAPWTASPATDFHGHFVSDPQHSRSARQ